MKPIDLFGTDLASETGRQAINSFINGKSFPERIYDNRIIYKPNAFSSPRIAFHPTTFILERTNGKIPEMYKDILDRDTLIALG